MKRDSSALSAHPSGEQSLVVARKPPGVDLDSFFGPVRVEWDHEAALTPLGQLPFFIHYLKASGLFDALVADCPLRYRSPNAPDRRDVVGTTMLSMLAGHKRYAHIAALRCDAVLPDLLGMKKIVSEDAIRRAFKAVDETEGAAWLRQHLQYCVEPLLAEPAATMASVVIMRPAIEVASCSATRTTFAGSTMPAFSMSTYCSVWASKP